MNSRESCNSKPPDHTTYSRTSNTNHQSPALFAMLLSQLLAGAVFFVSLLIRNVHVSTALVAILTWTNYATSPVFHTVTESIDEIIITRHSRPQLFELLYGLPSPVCPETRYAVPAVNSVEHVPHQMSGALTTSHTPVAATSSISTNLLASILAIAVIFCGTIFISTFNTNPTSAKLDCVVDSTKLVPESLVLALDPELWNSNSIISSDNTLSIQSPTSSGRLSADLGKHTTADEGFSEHPFSDNFNTRNVSTKPTLPSPKVKENKYLAVPNLDVDSMSDEGFASLEHLSNGSHYESNSVSSEQQVVVSSWPPLTPNTSESVSLPSSTEDSDSEPFDIEERIHMLRYSITPNMVGLFPGVDETNLHHMAISMEEFAPTEHVCTDGPDVNAYGVRTCKHWYRCEKPLPEDGQDPSTHLVISNLNSSYVVDDSGDIVLSFKRITVFYDKLRLKREALRLGATRMVFFVPACRQDYPYAVVIFPSIDKAQAAFSRLQGRCLGHTGRHFRAQFVSPYDYTYGGRHLESSTAEIKPQIEPRTLEKGKSRPVRKRIVPPRSPSDRDEPPKPSAPRFRRAKNGMRVRITDDTI